MSTTCLLDANVILRFLMADHPAHYERVRQLILRAEKGHYTLVVTPWVVAEVIYVMRSTYGGSKEQIAHLLGEFIEGIGIVVTDHAYVADALRRFAEHNVDFVDCLLAAYGSGESLAVASFDRDLDRFSDVERLEP